MKAIFVRVPKVAGSFIKRSLFKTINLDSHCPASTLIKKYFTFSFVRNPWDRFVSAYFYLTSNSGHFVDNKLGKYISSLGTFKDFVLLCGSGFKPDFVFPNRQKNTFLECVPFIPQHYWVDKELDFVGRFESLKTDLEYVCKRLDI